MTADTGTPHGWTYTLHLPRDPRAPRIARITLRGVLRLHGLAPLVDTAELLASELVTNAVRHTDGPSSLRLTGDGRKLRLGVRDADPTIPPPFDRRPARTARCPATAAAPGSGGGPGTSGPPGRGRGLELVRFCAHDWGAYSLGDATYGTSGKLLWVELAHGPGGFGIAA